MEAGSPRPEGRASPCRNSQIMAISLGISPNPAPCILRVVPPFTRRHYPEHTSSPKFSALPSKLKLSG
jgi:hypothetical protein